MYTKKALRKQNFSTPTDQVVLVLVKVILIGKKSQISQHVSSEEHSVNIPFGQNKSTDNSK